MTKPSWSFQILGTNKAVKAFNSAAGDDTVVKALSR